MSATEENKAPSATATSTGSPTEKAPGVVSTRLDVMIDLETLSVKKDSLILSVGIVLFDPLGAPGTISKRWHFPMDLAAQAGGKLDLSTILDFWFKQPEACAAMTKLRADQPHRSPEGLLDVLENIFTLYPTACVWGNAPSFDCDIIKELLQRALGVEAPWKFYRERCYRTLKAEFGHLVELPKAEVAHDALSDAVAQATGVQLIMEALRRGAHQGS